MLRKFLFHMLFCGLVCPSLVGAADTSLLRIGKDDGLASSRLVLELSDLPAYRVQTSGQRVDLLLSGTTAAPQLSRLPEDDTLVKVLLVRRDNDLMVSFLLRRPPARALATALSGPARIAIDLFWEEGAVRPAIAFPVAGLPGQRRVGSSVTPQIRAKYPGRWEDFFREYRTPIRIPVALRYSLVPLPWYPYRAAGGELGAVLDRLAMGKDWTKTLAALQDLAARVSPGGEGETHVLALRAEALVHTGEMSRAAQLLGSLAARRLTPALRDRLGYLRAFALAASGQPEYARAALAELAEQMAAGSPLVPYSALLHGEIALDSGDPHGALELLAADHLQWPDGLRSSRDRRLADALAGSGQVASALPLYRPLLAHPADLAEYPFSLGQAAGALAEVGEDQNALTLYRLLARDSGLEVGARGLALVAEAQILVRLGEKQKATRMLRQRADFPNAEAGLRARMKLCDHDVLSGDEMQRRRASADYAEIARISPLRDLREEATFKQVLTLYLNQDLEACVPLLGSFLRDFVSGSLVLEGQALMREILPPVIRGLIARQDDLQAVVMVEQYRDLLVDGSVSGSFLIDVARATTRLGLFERACKVYLYLLDAAGGRPEEEGYYLPFLEVAFDRNEYALVRTYALRYLTRFPKGRDRARVFELQVRALHAQGQLEAAAALLKAPQRPESEALEVLATEIYWALGRYEDVAACLGGTSPGPVVAGPPQGLILKAEALCRLGRDGDALPIYGFLMGQEAFADQAAFRYGEISLNEGSESEGRNVLRRLAEEGNDPLWRKLAQETLVQSRW